MTDPTHLPPPGLRGDYNGSCIVCFHGTDTALAFEGEAEWVIAGLVTLGIPTEFEAGVMMSHFFDVPPGTVPDGIVTLGVQVCADCVERCPANFPKPRQASSVPVLRPLS